MAAHKPPKDTLTHDVLDYDIRAFQRMFGFSDECIYSQMFQDLTAHPVISWHQPQLDRDEGFCHQMPQSMHWHYYSKFLRGKINRIYQKSLHHLT